MIHLSSKSTAPGVVRSLFVATLAVAAAALVRQLLAGVLGDEAPLLVFTLAVLTAAAYGGLAAGLFATAASVVTGVFLFVQARLSALLAHPEEIALVILFSTVGFGVSILADRLRRATEHSRRSEQRYLHLIDTVNEGIWIIDSDGQIVFANRKMARMLGVTVRELLGLRASNFLHPQHRKDGQQLLTADGGEQGAREACLADRDGREIWVLVTVSAMDEGLASGRHLAMFTDVTHLRAAESSLQQQARLLNLSHEPILARAEDGTVTLWNRGAEVLYGWSEGEAKGRIVHELLGTSFPVSLDAANLQLREAGTWIGELVQKTRDGRRVVVESRWELMHQPVRGGVVLETNRDVTDRKQAEEELERQLQRLESLRTIDIAILGTTDTHVLLKTVASEAASRLGADVVIVYVLDEATLMLEPVSQFGQRQPRSAPSVRVGEGIAGRAAAERRTVRVLGAAVGSTVPRLRPFLESEGIESVVSTPLVAKGQLIGALSVFFRQRVQPTADWFGFYEVLAGQTAMALESTQAFHRLQQAHLDLRVAYDETIEGWARALELRDRETEGHTRRVTEMTLTLARRRGLDERSIGDIRRGALLHDIGKMAIPDNILLKVGPLTPEEWDIMRQHPAHAYRMLSTIRYLGPALDIPYCHHERWDGTGYPRGLKGEDIPVAARLFSVIDVWDALTSDRPYRQRWPEDRAVEYVRSMAGSQFDPAVVDLFVGFLAEDRNV